jgi:hypothetical protein
MTSLILGGAALLFIGLILFRTFPARADSPLVTGANCQAIALGMSYADVREVIKAEGKRTVSGVFVTKRGGIYDYRGYPGLIVYHWENPDGSLLILQFEDDQLTGIEASGLEQ